MDINKKKFLIDILIFILFLVITISGFILWLVLPRGGGGVRESSFIFDRHIWVGIHNWLSVGLILLIIVHLLLNWKWIKAMFKCFKVKKCDLDESNGRA